MDARELADKIEEVVPEGNDEPLLKEASATLRSQTDRLDAIKAAWRRINDGRGWLSCVEAHDCRCPADGQHDFERDCICGGDDFRSLMEE